MVVFFTAVLLGGCASVEQNSQEQEAAQSQLRNAGVVFNVTSFIQEAANGNLENIKLFVKGGMDVNARSNETALTAASYYNKMDVVKYLVENGAKVNNGSYYDEPLIAAVRGGSFEITKYLVEHGGDVNIVGYAYVTPLFVAAEKGQAEIAEMLIKNGADVHYMQPNTGYTPLMAAAYVISGNLPVVEVLVKAGANVNYKIATGMSVLDWAISRRKFDVAKYLVSQGADVSDGQPADVTPRTMLSALAWGSPEMVQFLVKHGVDINSKAFGKMPLVIWCAKNMLENMAVTLVDMGADTKVRFADASLLDVAIQNREEGLIRKLDPSYDLNKARGELVDPNIQSQKAQINDIMGGGGTYYKAQDTPNVKNAVDTAVKTNEAVSQAADQAIGVKATQQDDVPQNAGQAGNIQEAKSVTDALKEQGNAQSHSFDYPVDQEKLENEIDDEIKNIESKYSVKDDSKVGDEDSWYKPVETPATGGTTYDSPVEAPNQDSVKSTPSVAEQKPYQYVTPNTLNQELAPEATGVVDGSAFSQNPQVVKPITTGEMNDQVDPTQK